MGLFDLNNDLNDYTVSDFPVFSSEKVKFVLKPLIKFTSDKFYLTLS